MAFDIAAQPAECALWRETPAVFSMENRNSSFGFYFQLEIEKKFVYVTCVIFLTHALLWLVEAFLCLKISWCLLGLYM